MGCLSRDLPSGQRATPAQSSLDGLNRSLPDPFLVGRGSLQACLQGALPGSTPDHVASRKDNIAMTIVAEHFDTVVGVDTHAATHTLAVVTAASGPCS